MFVGMIFRGMDGVKMFSLLRGGFRAYNLSNVLEVSNRNDQRGERLLFGLGATELIIILVIALIVFGPGKLPELGKSIGRGIREFKKATDLSIADDEDESSSKGATAD